MLLRQRGFALNPKVLQEIAYKLAENLVIKQKFNKELGRAGTHWFLSFMERNKNLSTRKCEGNVNRDKGINRDEVSKYFELLQLNSKPDLCC